MDYNTVAVPVMPEEPMAPVMPETPDTTVKATKETKKGISKVLFCYAALFAFILTVEFSFGALAEKITPFVERIGSANMSLLLTIVAFYVIGFPLIYLLLKRLPKKNIEKKKMTFWQYVIGITINAGLVFPLALVGSLINYLITGSNNTNILEIMMGSNPVLRILTVAFLAPIFEELIFRKLLIDHLAQYSKVLAIVTSGILFGMFHGNFAQALFATALGMFFGLIYVRTGNILYTIGYHIIINFSTSVITLTLLANTMENMNSFSSAMMLLILWMGILGMVALTGFVLFFVFMKQMPPKEEEGALKGKEAMKALFKNPGFWVAMALLSEFFVRTYTS